MNAITDVPAVSAETLEHVLGTGDLKKLTTPQRVEYYRKTCESLGLNPLTRPIRFLELNGQIQLYFTRDGTDQLRKANGITLHVVDKVVEAGVYAVTVRARDKHGREDEDVGAVALPAGGESRANALMKAITKAKRRVTLSICGLGQTDESELDTMPGARTFDADEEPPVVRTRTLEHSEREAINDAVPLKAAAAPIRAERKVDPTVYEPQPKPKVDRSKWSDAQWRAWIDKLGPSVDVLYSRSDVVDLGGKDSVKDAIQFGPPWVREEVSAILNEAYKRFPMEKEDEPTEDELGEVEIAGEAKVAAG